MKLTFKIPVQLATVSDHSDSSCMNLHPPFEPPSLKELFVLLYHAIALKAAAVTEALHNFHQTNLAGKEQWRMTSP